jgi:hypothetical protein
VLKMEWVAWCWVREYELISEALGLSLGACSELLDGCGAAGMTGHPAGTPTSLVTADDVLRAGYEQVAEATQEPARRRGEVGLIEAYAEARLCKPRSLRMSSKIPVGW